MAVSSRHLLFLGALIASASCDQASDNAANDEDEVVVLSGTESVQRFGDYEVHFNALRTTQLTPEIAAEYGIVRSPNRAMLNVSILQRQGDGSTRAVTADVDASAINLTGQLKSVAVREIQEGTAIYYIGETAIIDAETLIFTVDVAPDGDAGPFKVRFQKQFFVD